MKKFSIVPYLMRYKWQYILGIFVLFVVDFASLYIPQFMGEIIDGLSAGSLSMNGVLALLLDILGAGILMMLGRFGWRYFIIGASRGVEYHLRNDMFAHVETLSASYYNEHKTGDLMAFFTNDLQAVREATGMAIITTFDAILMTVMVLVKMIFYVDLKLTVLAFVPLTLVAVACFFFGSESKKRQERRQDAFSFLSDKVQESFSGIRVMKAFVQEEKDFSAFERASVDCMKKNLDMVKLRAVIGPVFDTITGLSILMTLVFGGRMVLNGEVSIGQFVAFNSYIGMLVWPMIACGECINLFSRASASFHRIASIFASKPDIVDHSEEAEKERHLRGDIELKDLTFTYPDGTDPVLSHVNLKIKQGETLAILGRTGSGKSSLADLLLRMYDCESGMLLLDGVPIDKLSIPVIHRDVAYVPQDNFLFSDTLMENIAFGLEERIKDHPELVDRVYQAAKDACIHDNIVEFQLGYETLVGERGVTLSGGQKQRSAIARALLMDAPILILDDSLSAVDTDTEEQILLNLKKNRADKTTILISHRISTLKRADHIAVFEEGRLTEYGTHDELVALGGFYCDIHEKQQLEKELEGM